MKTLAILLLTMAPAPVYRERPIPDVVPGVYLLIADNNVHLVTLSAGGSYRNGHETGPWTYRKGVLTLHDRPYRVRSHHDGVWVGDGFRLILER